MGFFDFLKGIGAELIPGGGTYGSYNPPKKKLQPGDPGYVAPAVSRAPVFNQPSQNTLRVQRPENLFQGLNQNLRIQPANVNQVPVQKTPSVTPAPTLAPGTVVKPNLSVSMSTPSHNIQLANGQMASSLPARNPTPQVRKTSFLGHLGNGLKIAKDTALGTVASLPEVGLAAGRTATGIVQGVTQVPHLATAGLATITKKANDIAPNSFNRTVNNIFQAANTGTKNATNVVDTPIDIANRGLDRAAKNYATHVPMAGAGDQVYHATQVPLNVLAAVATGGASAAGEGGADAGKVAQITRFLNKPLTKNTENVISKTGRVVNNKTAPVVQHLTTPIRSTKGGITKLVNRRILPSVERGAVNAGETGNVLSDAQLQELTQPPTQIPVATGIDVNAPSSVPVSIPIRTLPSSTPLIREVGGDAPNVTRIPTLNEAAATRFQNQNFGTPDNNIEGVTPRSASQPFKLSGVDVAARQNDAVQQYADFLKSVGEGNGTQLIPDGEGGYTRTTNNFRTASTAGKRMTKQDWLDEAKAQLEAGKAEPTIQKLFDEAANPEVQSLLDKASQAQDVPAGRPIAVKEVKGIPVQDKTVLPAGLPETPGTVRPIEQTSPMTAKTEAAASAPVVTTPAALPKETQAVLDNPKQYNKRQVAAARNQAKLAKKYAKTQEDIVAATDRANAASPVPQTSAGFVPTGEFRRGANGNVSQVAHGATEATQGAVDTANLSSGDVLAKATQEISQNGGVSAESVRNLQAMLDSGRFSQTSPEYQAMAKVLYGAGSDYGRGLSLFNPTMRRTATGDQLANRFISKLYGVAEDGSKLTDAHVAAVSQAENSFTAARDAASQALDRYNSTKSAADFNTWKQATQVADDAGKQALITEYKVANDVLKGNKDPAALKSIQDAEKKAGLYQMDWIDSSMLSGTGTFTRNFVNTSLVRAENRLFGGRGYSSKGAKIGNQAGNRSLKADFAARNELNQNKFSRAIKQWSTTGNTLGESHISAVAQARAYKFYENQLKAEGVTGDQLARDTEIRLHTDAEQMAQHYQQWALSENALSSMSHNSKKIEQTLVDAIASKGGGKLSQTAAKAIVRLTIGFPTVIGRSLVGGAKRATLGLPELGMAGRALARGDKQMAADLLYNAKVHFGSGAALYGLGTVLASAGLISPAYPTDKAEQARWKAEGIQPDSIKIGGQWFGIPGFFGALALPLVIPANIQGRDNPKDIVAGVVNGLQDLAPTSGLINFVNGMEGRSGKQWVKNEITSLTRAVTPVGSLLNEISKMTDPTKNDTTTKDAIHNVLDAIAGGIPGLNNAVNKIPATDANGNVLHNPNPVATFFGAVGSDQSQGQQDVQQAQEAANATYAQLDQYGVLQNQNLMGLVDKKTQAAISRGEDLTPEQVTAVQKAVVKGISTGLTASSDSNWRENGDYATDRTALQVKLQLLQADPTAKKSDINNLNTQIARDNVLEKNKVPYEDLKQYQDTTLSEWRQMGDPTSDNYDPAAYQKLWNIDQEMAKAGGSYNTDPKKNKYSAKKAGSGRGSGRSFSADFGTLKAGDFAPTVQQYQTIDQRSGSVPVISVVRPNIVHKISSSG